MPTDPLLALTLWPESAWAICALDKRVENRPWQPGQRIRIGDRFAIHAGKHIGGRPGRRATNDALEALHTMSCGLLPDGWESRALNAPRSAIVAVATLDATDNAHQTRWDVPGAWHWRLRDVVVLPEPIPCRGALGLWRPAPEVQQRLAEVLDAG